MHVDPNGKSLLLAAGLGVQTPQGRVSSLPPCPPGPPRALTMDKGCHRKRHLRPGGRVNTSTPSSRTPRSHPAALGGAWPAQQALSWLCVFPAPSTRTPSPSRLSPDPPSPEVQGTVLTHLSALGYHMRRCWHCCPLSGGWAGDGLPRPASASWGTGLPSLQTSVRAPPGLRSWRGGTQITHQPAREGRMVGEAGSG